MADPSPTTGTTGPAAVLSQLKQLWERQSKGRRMLAVLVLLGVLGVVGATTFLGRTESWVPIADGASPDDSQELLSALQARGLSSRLRDGKVEVSKDDLEAAHAVAAAAGLPRSGKGFEIFDGSNLGQSSFAEQVNYRRALQGELQRSITALAQVQGARVHIALGRRSVFKEQAERATASVALHLHPGQTLSAEQVRGVRQLVAASIEGLNADAVVVVDNHGNLLDAPSTGTGDQRQTIEQTIATRVRTMLERVVGEGKVSVVATAVVDERKVSETSELYDNTNPVVRSETKSAEGADAASAGFGGVAGTRGNLPGAAAAGPTGGGTGAGSGGPTRIQETKNYEISRTVRQTTKPDVQLQKVQLAVVVDYKADKDGKPVPRTEKELAELTALARQAAGIDDARGDKIELRSIAFAPDAEANLDAPVEAKKLPLIPIAIGAGAGVLLMFVLAMLLKKKKSKQQTKRSLQLALPAPVAELERVLEARPHDRVELDSPDHTPKLPPGQAVRDRVLEAVRGDVERTAEVFTAWLSELPATTPANAKGAKP